MPIWTRQAIVTKYHGPTNSRGSRISAKCAAGRVFVSWNYALNAEENHAAAVRALIAKLGWVDSTAWHMGCMPCGGYCAVNDTGYSEVKL